MVLNSRKQIFILLLGIIIVSVIISWKINNADKSIIENGVTNSRAMQTNPNSLRMQGAEPNSQTNTANTQNKTWNSNLTKQQYYILHEKGTETPFSSPLDFETRPGTYVSADCNEPVFRSEQKYDSGTGWPSFWAPINEDAVVLADDNSLFLSRTEVLSKCGGHLGHVFDDGPAPTGKRYCINGDALIFIPDQPNKN